MKKKIQAASQTQDYTAETEGQKYAHLKWKYVVANNRAMMIFN